MPTQAGTNSTRGGLAGTLNILQLRISVPLPSGGLRLSLARFLSPHLCTLWFSTVSASPSRWFNASRAGPVHLLICHRHIPSSTTVPEVRPRKASFSHTSSRADPSPRKICRTATVGSLGPLGGGEWSQTGQQRNSIGALALLIFLGGPCNTISKYKSKSIKGADTLPSSPNSAHLHLLPPFSVPQSLCLGDPKGEEWGGPCPGRGASRMESPRPGIWWGSGEDP